MKQFLLKTNPKSILIWLDDNFERKIMIFTYGFMASLLFFEVVRRFFLRVQTTWGSEIAIHLFIWMSWFGCSYAIKENSHLSFPAVREKLSNRWRLTLRLLDNAIWLGLTVVIYYGSSKTLSMLRIQGSLIPGTDFLPMWISYACIPIAAITICIRVLQASWKLCIAYRRGETV